MKKILFSAGFLLLANLSFSQWSQVNNGIQDLSLGVRSISGHNGNLYPGVENLQKIISFSYFTCLNF